MNTIETSCFWVLQKNYVCMLYLIIIFPKCKNHTQSHKLHFTHSVKSKCFKKVTTSLWTVVLNINFQYIQTCHPNNPVSCFDHRSVTLTVEVMTFIQLTNRSESPLEARNMIITDGNDSTTQRSKRIYVDDDLSNRIADRKVIY